MNKKVLQYLAAPISLVIGIAVAYGIATSAQKSFEELWALYVLIPTLFVVLAVVALRRPDIFKPYGEFEDPWQTTEQNEQARQEAATAQSAATPVELTPEEEPGEYIRFKCQWTKYAADVSDLTYIGGNMYQRVVHYVSAETLARHNAFSKAWIKNLEHRRMLRAIALRSPREILTEEEYRRAEVYGVAVENIPHIVSSELFPHVGDVDTIHRPVHPRQLREEGGMYNYGWLVRHAIDRAVMKAKERHMERTCDTLNLHEHRTLHPAKRRSSYIPPRW